MRFYYNNLALNATLTASSADTEYPISNVQNAHKTKVWKTLGTSATEYIIFDLATAQAVTSFIAFSTDFDGTETTLKIQGNATNSWGSPSVNETLTYDSTYKYLTENFASATYRYWRFVFTKANASDIRSVGAVFIGTKSDTTYHPDQTGLEKKWKSRSTASRSEGGQLYATYRGPYRVFKVSFGSLPESDAAILRAVYAYCDKSYPFWVQVRHDIVDLSEYLYCVFDEEYGEKLKAFGSSDYWTINLGFEELL